jgi:predicted transcriptional regulator
VGQTARNRAEFQEIFYVINARVTFSEKSILLGRLRRKEWLIKVA